MRNREKTIALGHVLSVIFAVFVTLTGFDKTVGAQEPTAATGTRPAITLVSMDRSQKSPVVEPPTYFGAPSGVKPCKPSNSGNELLIINFRSPSKLDVGIPEVTDPAGTKYRQLCAQLVNFNDGHVEGALVFDVPIGKQISKLTLAGQEFNVSRLGKTGSRP